MKVYVVEYITRTSYKDKLTKIFSTLEDASENMIKNFSAAKDYYSTYSSYTSKDFYDPAPEPTKELAEELFSKEALERFIAKNDKLDKTIYCIWDKCTYQQSFQITIMASELD